VPVRAALYLRTSTGRQSVENQRPEVEGLASGRGFTVVGTYAEQESAAKRRPEFSRMLADARRGRFDVIVVWSLDRFGRGFSCFDAFRDLSRIGVRVVSVREPWTEADGPALELLVAVMSWVSGFERQRLAERIRAGLDRARREGKRLGRLPASPLKLAAAAARVQEGASIRSAAREKGLGAETLRRHLRAEPRP
jgi:DNA invertase Pin-like site-specific DNA recombinase